MKIKLDKKSMQFNNSKIAFKKKIDSAKPLLKSFRGRSKAAAVGAGVAIAPAVPIAIAGDVASACVTLTADLVESAGFVLALPSILFTIGFASMAEASNSKFGALAYLGACVSSLPGAAICLATGLASGVLKLGAGIIEVLTLAATAPFRAIAKGILRHADKKNEAYYYDDNDIIIDYNENEIE